MSPASIGLLLALSAIWGSSFFAMAWGALFRGETITVARMVGAVVILGGTSLIAVPAAPRAA